MEDIIKALINRETISYLFFGVLTTVVSIASYEVIKRLVSRGKAPSQLAINIGTIGSWILAVTFAYITNKLFVFQSPSFDLNVIVGEVAKFLGARLFSLGFEVVWMNVTTGILKWNDSLCKIIAQFVITVLNYIFSKFYIF